MPPTTVSRHTHIIISFVFAAYLLPFVRKIDLMSEFVLKSQWKYQVPFDFSKKQVKLISFSRFCKQNCNLFSV